MLAIMLITKGDRIEKKFWLGKGLDLGFFSWYYIFHNGNSDEIFISAQISII